MGIKKEAQPVVESLKELLTKFDKLIDEGCVDSCLECPLGKTVEKETYIHGSVLISGNTIVCDLLGVLSDVVIHGGAEWKS